MHEVSPAVALEARRLLRARGTEAAEVLLAERAIASRSSQVAGEHETIKELLARLPVRLRARHHIYTSAAARDLLADIDRCPARNLAAVLDYEMEERWPFAVNPPRSVAAKPLRWFTAALRRAVSRKHGFAVVFDTTLL